MLVSSKESSQESAVVLGVRDDRFYKLLDQLMVGSSGYLDT